MNKKKIIFICITIVLILLMPIKKIPYIDSINDVEYGIRYKSALYEIIICDEYMGTSEGIVIEILGNTVYNNRHSLPPTIYPY